MKSSLSELCGYFAQFAVRCRAARWLGALFHVRVCVDIAADIEKARIEAIQKAYDAEQADRLATKLLMRALANGLDESDVPAVRRAMTLICRSAKKDSAISTLLSA